jgi:hypothetical protein
MNALGDKNSFKKDELRNSDKQIKQLILHVNS